MRTVYAPVGTVSMDLKGKIHKIITGMVQVILLATAMTLSGCLSNYDKNIKNIEFRRGLLSENDGQIRVLYFLNKPTYTTATSECHRYDKQCPPLESLLNFFMNNYYFKKRYKFDGYISNETYYIARLSSSSKNEFTIDFINNQSKVGYSLHFVSGKDFKLGSKGEITFNFEGCEIGDLMAPIGCGSGSVQLFQDKEGNLVATVSASGAAVLVLVPVMASVDRFSVFPRAENAPTNF